MHDIDIRNKIKDSILRRYYEDNNSRVVEEMNVSFGDARIDMAVINGALHGFEIKSEKDTLTRLPNQINVYAKTFDYVTIVTGANHLEHIIKIVPSWCGIIVASHKKKRDGIKLSPHRIAIKNIAVEKSSIVQLLWKNEALDILNDLGITKGIKNKPKDFLWNLLAECLEVDKLSFYTREKLKIREQWKPESSLSESGGYFQLSSMYLDSQSRRLQLHSH